MLGKIPPFVLGPVGLVLILGLTVAGYMFMLKPKQAEIADIQSKIETEQKKAQEKQKVQGDLDKVNRDWETAHEGLAQIMDERSIPLSMGHPFVAMTNLWRETREDLPTLVEKLVRNSGCVLIQGTQGWTPPNAPLGTDVQWIRFGVGPSGATAGTAIPGGGNPLWVAGSLADVERLYKSLRSFPRAITIHHLGILRLRDMVGTPLYNQVRELIDRPDEEVVVAPIILTIYLLAEATEAAPAAAAAGPGGGAPGGAPGGAGGPPGGAPPGGEAAGGPPPGEGGPGAEAPPPGGGGGGGEEGGGGGADAGGGEE